MEKMHQFKSLLFPTQPQLSTSRHLFQQGCCWSDLFLLQAVCQSNMPWLLIEAIRLYLLPFWTLSLKHVCPNCDALTCGVNHTTYITTYAFLSVEVSGVWFVSHCWFGGVAFSVCWGLLVLLNICAMLISRVGGHWLLGFGFGCLVGCY